MTVRELRRDFLLRARRMRATAIEMEDTIKVPGHTTSYWRQAEFYRQAARELREVCG